MGRVIDFPRATTPQTGSQMWNDAGDSALPSSPERGGRSSVIRISPSRPQGTHDEGGGGAAA